MAKDKLKKVSTELEMDKACKSAARFRCADAAPEVTTSFYLLNEGWAALGKPTKIKLTASTVE